MRCVCGCARDEHDRGVEPCDNSQTDPYHLCGAFEAAEDEDE